MNQILILVLFDGKGTTKTAKLMILCYLIPILFYQTLIPQHYNLTLFISS